MDAECPGGAAAPPSEATLQQALLAIRPLLLWLLRSGIGHGAFSAALKPMFLDCAREELEWRQRKATDSALSLLSGLHRKDVRALAATAKAPQPGPAKASPAQQVVARWLAQDWPKRLALSGSSESFEALARTVSSDFHPRAILSELERLGIVSSGEGQVELQRRAYIPDPASEQAGALMAAGVADHLAAAVHNLSGSGPRRHLEQAVFADGLSPESARQLEQLANRLWNDALKTMVAAAVPLCERDEPAGGDQRIRLGMYCYSAAMAPTPHSQPQENQS